jgi:hypothetical protein
MMTQRDDGGPAFAGEEVVQNGLGDLVRQPYGGMTLRDYFAAKALPAILSGFDDPASRRLIKDSGANLQKVAAEAAYIQADAMLKARQS